MDWVDVAENWYAIVPRILRRWPDMEADELIGIDGDQDHFLDYLHEVLGGDHKEAETQLQLWLSDETVPEGIADFSQYAGRRQLSMRGTKKDRA